MCPLPLFWLLCADRVHLLSPVSCDIQMVTPVLSTLRNRHCKRTQGRKHSNGVWRQAADNKESQAMVYPDTSCNKKEGKAASGDNSLHSQHLIINHSPQCCGGTRCVPLSALRTSCWQIPPTAALRPLLVKPAGFPLVLLYLSRSLSSLDLVLGIISHKTLTWVNSTW